MRVENIGDSTLYLGDCRTVLPILGRVSAVVTDPPYGWKVARNHDNHNVSRGKLAKPTDYGAAEWDSAPPPHWLLAQIRDMSDWQIIFGGNFFDLPPSSCWLIWDKQNSGDFADAEMAWTNLDKAVRLIQWRWNGMIRKGSDVREHPTQKPEGVMLWAVDHLPADAETILDPFMGSGTTGVAAVQRGRKFIGIEADERYFEIACQRIAEAGRQTDMFVTQLSG